jgi:hypothetical protein
LGVRRIFEIDTGEFSLIFEEHVTKYLVAYGFDLALRGIGEAFSASK